MHLRTWDCCQRIKDQQGIGQTKRNIKDLGRIDTTDFSEDVALTWVEWEKEGCSYSRQ